MLRTILVADCEEIQKLARSLPVLTTGLSGSSRLVPVFTTSSERQLVIVQAGSPVMAYKVPNTDLLLPASPSRDSAGVSAMQGFMETFNGSKHLVMLYDNPKLARNLEFLYLSQGLEKWNERCIYMLPNNDIETVDSITRKMEEFGIDTARHSDDGSLRIEAIDYSSSKNNSEEKFRACWEKILHSLRTHATVAGPLRVVLHVRYKFDEDEEIQEHADFEDVIQSYFDRGEFKGSMLCNHYIGHNDETKHAVWTNRMFQTHDSVFLISEKIDRWLAYNS